jgi:hypothetical protein
MRITVSQVLEMLAGGMTREQILADFPYLESADIDACLEYAARQAAHRELRFLQQTETGSGDYSRERHSRIGKEGVAALVKRIERRRKNGTG